MCSSKTLTLILIVISSHTPCFILPVFVLVILLGFFFKLLSHYMIEGLPGVLENKEKYRGKQGNVDLFLGTWEQVNLYKFSLRGMLMVGKVVGRYVKHGRNNEIL